MPRVCKARQSRARVGPKPHELTTIAATVSTLLHNQFQCRRGTKASLQLFSPSQAVPDWNLIAYKPALNSRRS